jgi:hypothetical protein
LCRARAPRRILLASNWSKLPLLYPPIYWPWFPNMTCELPGQSMYNGYKHSYKKEHLPRARLNLAVSKEQVKLGRGRDITRDAWWRTCKPISGFRSPPVLISLFRIIRHALSSFYVRSDYMPLFHINMVIEMAVPQSMQSMHCRLPQLLRFGTLMTTPAYLAF